MMAQDADLLRRYVEDRSDDAFAQIVRRHVDLVYAAAMRQVRDPGRAQDVTQLVFVALAQKAAGLRRGTVLSAWLVGATRRAAAHVRRGESRRTRHERDAARARAGRADESAAAVEQDPWADVTPVLDELIAVLSARNRAAVVMRYLEGNGVDEVARRLGISPDAAKQRMSRGVVQLRGMLARRGFKMSAAALSASLAANSASAAPPGLAARVSAASHAPAATGAIQGAIMASTKAKMTAAAICVALLGGAALYSTRSKDAGGGNAAPGRPVALVRTSSLTGTVRTPDGKPVDGAEVILGTQQAPVAAYSDPSPEAPSQLSAADGTFAFPTPVGPAIVVARNAYGYAAVAAADLGGRSDVVLRPWAHIEGVLKVGGGVATDRTVNLRRFDAYYDPSATLARHDRFAQTDAAGHFEFRNVAPGLFILSLRLEEPYRHTHETFVDARPGETAHAIVGQDGVTVTGTVAAPLPAEGRYAVSGVLWPQTAVAVPYPTDWKQMAGPEREQWMTQWHKTPAGQSYHVQRHGHHFDVAPDGTFAVQDIPSGTYRLRLAAALVRAGKATVEEVAVDERDVEVPAPGPGVRVDAGTIELKPGR